jgi:hypothetical protein
MATARAETIGQKSAALLPRIKPTRVAIATLLRLSACAALALVIIADIRLFISDYLPLLSVLPKPRQFEIYAPMHTYCRRGTSAPVSGVPSQVTVREITVRFSAGTTASIDTLQTVLNNSWGDSTALRIGFFTSKADNPARSNPFRFPHLSTYRTLQLTPIKSEGITLLTHLTHIRVCPAGMY